MCAINYWNLLPVCVHTYLYNANDSSKATIPQLKSSLVTLEVAVYISADDFLFRRADLKSFLKSFICKAMDLKDNFSLIFYK